MGRKGGLGAQAIVDRHTQPTALGHVIHQRHRLFFLLADHPRTTMHLQQNRKTALSRFMRVINVQKVALARITVADVAVLAHTLALETKWLQPVPGIYVIRQSMLTLNRNPGTVILPQRTAQ